MNIHIRNEAAGDAAQIFRVTELAFLSAPHTDHSEQFIVNRLRKWGALTISQVAEVNGHVVGHVAVSPVTVSDGTTGWFGLGPLSVLPEFQRQGVGARLMENALSTLVEMDAAGCVVLGDPDYYGRFGFKACNALALPGMPVAYFQALTFDGTRPCGEVAYHKAFYSE